MIRIPFPLASAIRAHLESSYPEEGCGCLLSDQKGNWYLRPCTNIQNALHHQDPSTYPRDAKTAYFIDPQEILEISRETESLGRTIHAWYHSHPDHPAFFSEEDRKYALIEDWNEPLYPQAFYLVYSVRHGVVVEVKAFAWNEKYREFLEVPVREELHEKR